MARLAGRRAVSGRCRVDDLADEVLLSPRQLRALIVAELGLAPKQLLRLFRFHAVIGRLSAGGRAWATSPRPRAIPTRAT